ncbi:hypothetical protein OGAPHI_006156 [Ogataea philodendri]|uniref:Uncharacterized protein n=1 Tax=Ogataea philodendri TaxID=1378263 RepID=A0A9P8NZB2_9ASCO|nr:uncharacterized protein OGAPHI_006156 [Ogataea philodendri]KAH3661977.1 hypothetical protein OGAPHI_006156 [Ogataea philodendri]
MLISGGASNLLCGFNKLLSWPPALLGLISFLVNIWLSSTSAVCNRLSRLLKLASLFAFRFNPLRLVEMLCPSSIGLDPRENGDCESMVVELNVVERLFGTLYPLIIGDEGSTTASSKVGRSSSMSLF